MKHYSLFLILMILFFNLFSQDFPPPEEIEIEGGWAKVMWQPPSLVTRIDTLENYNLGDYLAEVSPNWTTWSNLPGSSEDAIIEEYFYQNCAKIEDETNLIMEMDTYNSGRFSYDIELYIPEDHCAYFNLQKTNVPGEELGFEIFFGADTTATINAGGEAAMQFPFWNGYSEFNMIIDLDNDWAELYYFKYLLYEYQWSLGTTGNPGLNSIGGVNISTQVLQGSGDNPLFYLRDARLRKQYTDEEGLTGYNIYLDGVFWDYIDSSIITTYYYEDLWASQTYNAGLSSVFQNPTGESEIICEELDYFPGPIPPFPPENVTALVNNYNEILLTWDQPFWVLTHSLYGYNIYRNNIFVHRVLGPDILLFQDDPLPADDYEYYLEGIYVQNPDFPWPSNTATCTIEFPIPENVTTTTFGSDILVEWTFDPPSQRDLLGFKVYRNDCLIVNNITEYFYWDPNVPSGTYTYNVSAIFSGNFESELSEDMIIVHVNTDDNEIQNMEITLSNYPNPFNPSTTISFNLTTDITEDTKLEIYNLKGQKVKTINCHPEFIEGSVYEGKASRPSSFPERRLGTQDDKLRMTRAGSNNYYITWDGTDQNGNPVSSGIYLYRLKAGNVDVSRKMLFLK